MNIFVGNLSDMTTARHLLNLFVSFGAVRSVKIMMDGVSGHSRGFAYVVMDNRAGYVAIRELNNMQFMNSYMEVAEAGL